MKSGKIGLIEVLLIAGIVISVVLGLTFHFKNTEQQRTDDWIRSIASGEESERRETSYREEISEDRERVSILTPETAEIPIDPAVYEDPADRKIDFTALLEVNPDIIAWIFIPGTNIDYPVLCAPEGMDEDHYLRRDINGKYNSHGCIYARRSEMAEDGSISVIYGHNMRDGTMFGSLTYVDADELFLYTPTAVRRYVFENEEIRDPEELYLAGDSYDLTLCTCTRDGSQRYLKHYTLSPPTSSDPFNNS